MRVDDRSSHKLATLGFLKPFLSCSFIILVYMASFEFTFGPSPKIVMPENTSPAIMPENTSTAIINQNEGVTQDRNVRTRSIHGYGIIPYDNHTFPPGLKEVDIIHMMKEYPEVQMSIPYLQLIHILSGSNSGHTMTAYQSFYKKNKEASTSSHYYILFLFRDVSSKDG